jgi:tape measure domain-containing protein
MAAASIIIDLLMKTGSFETDTQRAGRALQKLNKQTKDSATAIAGEFKRVQDAIAKAGMTASQQKLFELKGLGASQQQLVAYARNLEELDRKTKSLSTSTLSLSNSVKTAASAFGVGFAFSSITQLSDSYIKFTAQLKNATNSAADFGAAYQNVQRVAQSTQFDIEAVGTTYSRLSQATRDLGISQQQVSDIVETIGLTLKTQGATTAEASSAMLQLSQAFGAGRLNGDEFRSAMENVPGLMRELAKEMGVPLGELKELAKEGKLTADVLVKVFSNPELLASLRDQAKEIRTISGGYTEIANQLKLLVGEENNAIGVTSLFAKSLGLIADAIERIRRSGGVDIGLANFVPGGSALSIVRQASELGRRDTSGQTSSGQIKFNPAAPSALGFDELSKGLNLASIKIKELVKTQEEAVRSLNSGKITYNQYKEIIAATGKELADLTEKTKKKTKANKEEIDALKNFAKQQKDIANILQKARDLNAPEVSKFEQLQEELDAYTQLNPAIREYAENMILAAKAREQASQWEEVMNDSLEREIEAYNEASEAQADFEKSIQDYVTSVERAADPTLELADNIGKLQSALNLDLIDQETYDRLAKFVEENEKNSDQVTEFWKEAARNIQDAFADGFFDFMQGELGNLEQTFKRTIDRMVANLLAAQLTDKLFGADFGKSGKLGSDSIIQKGLDWFGDLLPSFDVGTPYVQRDMVAKIHKGERILTAQENRAFSTGKMSPQINMTVYANDAGSFMRSTGQIAKDLQRKLNQAGRVS